MYVGCYYMHTFIVPIFYECVYLYLFIILLINFTYKIFSYTRKKPTSIDIVYTEYKEISVFLEPFLSLFISKLNLESFKVGKNLFHSRNPRHRKSFITQLRVPRGNAGSKENRENFERAVPFFQYGYKAKPLLSSDNDSLGTMEQTERMGFAGFIALIYLGNFWDLNSE